MNNYNIRYFSDSISNNLNINHSQSNSQSNSNSKSKSQNLEITQGGFKSYESSYDVGNVEFIKEDSENLKSMIIGLLNNLDDNIVYTLIPVVR